MANDDDRLDRNNRNNGPDTGDRMREHYYELKTSIAVITTKMDNLQNTVKDGFVTVDTTFREFNGRYATKEDLKTVATDIDDVKKNLNRGVWIVITAVIMGVLTVVFKSGVLHA